MLQSLPDIVSFLFSSLTSIFNIYVTSSVLAGFFCLWILDRLFHIFDILKR